MADVALKCGRNAAQRLIGWLWLKARVVKTPAGHPTQRRSAPCNVA